MLSFRDLTDILYEATTRDEIMSITSATEDEAKKLSWRFSQVRSRVSASESAPEYRIPVETLEIRRVGKVVLVGMPQLFPANTKTKPVWLSPDALAELIENQ